MSEPVLLFRDDYLLAQWGDALPAYADGRDGQVLAILRDWRRRDRNLSETQLEGAFVQRIVCDLWGYRTSGSGAGDGYTAMPQYPVPGAGQRGGTGKADVAFAHFRHPAIPDVPQVLGEFKDVRSGLDAPQARKGNTRSPVQQCIDYLKHAFDRTPVNSRLQPTWGLVTDMRQFRLYCRGQGVARYQAFVVGDDDLLAGGDHGVRRRFLFARVFSPESLLAPFGRSDLLKLLDGQLTEERNLEKGFHKEYQAFRQHVYETIVAANPGFPGTRGDLVRLTQRFLDRCIFLLFCEDMGRTLDFPPGLLQKTLVEQSQSGAYAANHETIWPLVKELFKAMRDGGTFPPDHRIARLNGGLFAELNDLDRLHIPNHVFCVKGQGQDAKSLAASRRTLLYLAASYNFGTTEAGTQRTITLYALGRIFEQSITDLEYMHAEAEGVDTVAKLSKRKRNGVYYTPEWVTGYIVEQVVGGRLADERERLGLTFGAQFRLRKKDGQLTAEAERHLDKLEDYRDSLGRLRILDPACGSGAFLIQALQYLRQHYRDVAAETARVTGAEQLFDADAVVRGILGQNLYGVDLNPESVEITQLALWLHTATKGQPLTTLDAHIRCGNSLIGPDFKGFYVDRHGGTLFDDIDPNEQEKINVFDWEAAFPEVLGPDVAETERGFDCVIGNPPYVKLQHIRKIRPDEIAYLTDHTRADGSPRYRSTQTGNFDLYLPFIERGVELLNGRGRMGYIAPSVWLKNDYGVGLKRHLQRTGALDRWVDFGSYQVFDDVTVYTALQFFRGSLRPAMDFRLAPGGDVSTLSWDGATHIEPHKLDPEAGWLLMEDDQRRVFDRMRERHARLDDEKFVTHIFQGLITSADWCYHLQRVGPGRYVQDGGDGEEYRIEDEIMLPIVSGPDVKRYVDPSPGSCVLFPYRLDELGTELRSANEMSARFPNAWAYLSRHENKLRRRERGAFDDDQWYRFGRNQNLDKQHLPKLMVPRLVDRLRCVFDRSGDYCLDNVDVGGVIPAREEDGFYLTGILNSPAAHFYFRWVSKPFRGGYFSANKQFIAPIPIPEADDDQRRAVAEAAERLQEMHTRRRDMIAAFGKRLDSPQCVDAPKPLEWLWADVAEKVVAGQAPPDLGQRDRKRWIKDETQRRLAEHYEKIDAVLSPGLPVTVQVDDDALSLYLAGTELLTRYGLTGAEAVYLAALWRHTLRTTSVTASVDARKLIDRLLTLRTTADATLRQWFVDQDAKLTAAETEIEAVEQALNDCICELYGLDESDRRVVESR